MKIYHNPRCMKSRETLKLIESNGSEVEIVEYLKKIPTSNELKDLLMKLNMKAKDLVRKAEEYLKKELKGKEFS